MRGNLYIVAGCSGVGKGTILKKFLERNENVKFSISATTRKPRVNEVDGVNYFYISQEEFKSEIENNAFLEWAEFSGNFYGTKKAFVEKTLDKGIDVLLEIEVRGAKQVKEKMPEAISVFIMPPSLEELENRLRGRKTEDETTIQRRLNEAAREIEAGKNFDYRVVNDNIEDAILQLEKIYNSTKGK